VNIYKLHSNPDELIGYTDRNFYFEDEARDAILQGKEVTKVIGDLHLRYTDITSLPDNLTVGGLLNLSRTQITALPDNLTVGGLLDITGTKITSLPDNLKVGGSLWLRNTPNLDKNNLPSSLVVKGKIYK
jgi:hypothetical protein